MNQTQNKKTSFSKKVHSELIRTNLFKLVEDTAYYKAYELFETPFRLKVYHYTAKEYSDFSWTININSPLIKNSIYKINKNNKYQKNYVMISEQEFLDKFTDMFNEFPDYIQTGFIMNLHLFPIYKKELA